jgi:hypothetical protein
MGCRYTGHNYDRLTQSYTDGWSCGGFGTPTWLLMQIRAENSRACPWWICSDGLPPGFVPTECKRLSLPGGGCKFVRA